MFDVPEIEAAIAEEMDRCRVPGFALAVIEGDEVVYARGFGVCSVESPGTPVTPETIFCCGSISKSLTAVTILRLAGHGLLDLDEPVTTYLPWLRFSRPEYAAGVTLRRLLSHSSGLFGTAGNFGPRDLETLGTFMRETVPDLHFVAPPGVVYEYSSLGVDLAGYVAEVVAGHYFPDVVREGVLEPLAMRRTFYDRTVAMTYEVALPHATSESGEPVVQHRMFDYAAANPAGQAMASTLDLAHLVIMAMNGGEFRGRQVLRPDLAMAMREPQIGFRDAEGSGYGIGFFTLRYRGHSWIAHGGMLTPYLCEISFLPHRSVGVVWQCNVTNEFDPYSIRRRILDHYLDDHTPHGTPGVYPPGSAAPPPHVSLSEYAGTYFSLAAGFATIGSDGAHLILERHGERTPLAPFREDRFADPDGAVVVGFVPPESGQAQYFMLDEHAYCRFDPEATMEIPRAQLETYRGHFQFDDGDTATTWIENGALHLAVSWQEGTHPCIPLDAATFASDLGLVQFRRQPSGDVVLVWAGGVVTERLAA